MLDSQLTNKYKKDFKLMRKQNRDMDELEKVVNLLQQEQELPAKYKDHELIGNYVGSRECHLESDWLLIYTIDQENKKVILERTGTHTTLFESKLTIQELNKQLSQYID